MITIVKTGSEGIPRIHGLSHLIWPETYRHILTEEQISYMLEMMYSKTALETQISQKGHQFILAMENEEAAGFASYGLKSTANHGDYRLHKLYVMPGLQGKGVGKKLIQYIVDDIMPIGGKKIELNVNKLNPAKGFYEKAGFHITGEEKTGIGGGFFMDDFVMETLLPGFFVS
jgi:ribosomal protein S18 acetylase RimI-like enzyme